MVNFQQKDRYDWDDLVEIIRLLRAPDGCPWDAEQTHLSIRRDLMEETFEVVDAMDRDSAADLCEELGDLLLQVVFHAQIERERERFTVEDVIDGVAKKMIFRHPHVFANETAKSGAQLLERWDALKRQEKGQTDTTAAMEAVPHTLPALWRAEKVQKKAAKAGFAYAETVSALEKLEEEVRELRLAVESGAAPDAPHGVKAEVGDVLFAAANVARMEGIEGEEALHCACDRFVERFGKLERGSEQKLECYSEAELLRLWTNTKQ